MLNPASVGSATPSPLPPTHAPTPFPSHYPSPSPPPSRHLFQPVVPDAATHLLPALGGEFRPLFENSGRKDSASSCTQWGQLSTTTQIILISSRSANEGRYVYFPSFYIEAIFYLGKSMIATIHIS